MEERKVTKKQKILPAKAKSFRLGSTAARLKLKEIDGP